MEFFKFFKSKTHSEIVRSEKNHFFSMNLLVLTKKILLVIAPQFFWLKMVVRRKIKLI